MFNCLKRLFPSAQSRKYDPEGLRLAFAERYHQFKLLLSANNKALEVMSEMESALNGDQPFSMKFVRTSCIKTVTSVYQIIRHLNALAPEKYAGLSEKLHEIQAAINITLQDRISPAAGPLTLSLSEIGQTSSSQVGAKMASLGELKNTLGLSVPDGFVITAAAYQRFMDHNNLQPEIDRRIQAARIEDIEELHTLSASLQQLIIGAAVPSDIEEAVAQKLEVFHDSQKPEIRFALRSSALGEDLERTTFAGQYRSALNVAPENILHAYKEVVASKYGLTGMSYRLNRGIRDEDVAMCVGCTKMVNAAAGGVAYSRNPLHRSDDSIFISSCWGLPKLIVDGSAEADTFVVLRDEPLMLREKKIPLKPHQYVCHADEGICRLETAGENGGLPSLSDEQALQLARTAIRLEQHYGSPRDIEWCVNEDGGLMVLQCRPLKQEEDTAEGESIDSTPESASEKVLFENGVTASPGTAAGPVYIIQKDSDILIFPKGAVMVAEQALPRWAAVLQRASGIVTEYGSITGHLANVAREFRIPALFSVKDAAKRLQSGQMITVDAGGGKIYEGRLFELLRTRKRKNPIEGSAVYETLRKASRHIVPLNLLDPEALSFKPEHCRTLHDITRFCHEKAVGEMLNFGKDHHFPERSSKRLMVKAPMQWWVLNLDDGFKEEVEGKYVKLDEIVSEPMLALWKGITAVPWMGPPPVDTKGLVSVMFQATQNPALIPGLRSKYADRHYFMISKDYCCLNSRLGFHFSTVETFISERFGESYISFQFKGGAADYERRRKRIFFVKEILEGYHFRVTVKGDNLSARLEGFDKDLMLRNLQIVGYLAIHTRQLDMIMENSALVKYYRNKICKDIQDLFVREKILYLAIGDEQQG